MVVQPSLAQMENGFNHRFLKLVEAYENRAESKVNSVIQKYEESNQKDRFQYERDTSRYGKSRKTSVDRVKHLSKSTVISKSRDLVYVPKKSDCHQHCKKPYVQPSPQPAPKADALQRGFNSSTRVHVNTFEKKKSVSFIDPDRQQSLSKEVLNPIYEHEDPISESIQQRSTDTGFEGGKNLWAKQHPQFFYTLKLVGKGLDINPQSDNQFTAFSFQRGNHRKALIENL